MVRVSFALLPLLAAAHVSEEILETFRDSEQARWPEVHCGVDSEDPAGPRGAIVFVLRRDWAPRACDAFADLARAGFYDGARFFRVLPNFIAQFGFKPGGSPAPKRREADPRNSEARNARGTAAFAGGSKTQVFVNLRDNFRLDGESGPFATVEHTALLDGLYSGYREGSGQIKAYNLGTEALMRQFPRMSHVASCRVVEGRGHAG